MYSGGIDTHDLAVQAKAQADASKALTDRTKDLADRMKEQADRTKTIAEQAVIQAKAVQSSAKTSRDALVSVQRAFLVFNQAIFAEAIVNQTDPQHVEAWQFHITLENSGTTPTRHARHRVNWQVLLERMPDNFQFADLGVTQVAPFVLAPKDRMFGGVLEIPLATFTAMNAIPNSHLYLWGWALYQDIFSPVQHVSMFCSEMTPIRGDPTRPGTTFSFQQCAHHNCTDEECNGELGDPRQ
jgi:hypothetical protein